MAAARLLLLLLLHCPHQQAGACLAALQQLHSLRTWHLQLSLPMNQPMLADLAVLQAKLRVTLRQ
jgi:hypothetical protein